MGKKRKYKIYVSVIEGFTDMPGTKIIGTKDYSFNRKIRTRAFSNTCPVTQISSTLIGSWARDHVITNTLPRVMSSKKKKVLFKIILSWHRDDSLFSTFGYLLFSIFVSTMKSNHYTGEVVMAPLCSFVSVLWFEIKEKGPVPFIAWGCG